MRRGELREVNRSGSDYANFLLYGVASARVYLKQANHRCQQALERYAEPWSALAWLATGAPYPQGLLTQSWKYLLQNHPHDSICGCSIDAVHDENMTRFARAEQVARDRNVAVFQDGKALGWEEALAFWTQPPGPEAARAS